jgi:hypothetical protein
MPLRLPLHPAYNFAIQHGLQDNVDEIRNLKFSPQIRRGRHNTVRKGYMVSLLQGKRLWEEFVQDHWPTGKTPWGEKRTKHYLHWKSINDGTTLGDPEDGAEAEFPETPERDIEQALVLQLDTLGLHLFVDQEGRKGQQYPAGDYGRIDLLANDPNGDFVVIELKREALRPTIGQLAGYLAYVRKHLAKAAGRSAVGWIFARPSSSLDDQLLEEAAEAVGIKVKWYRLRLELLSDNTALRAPSVAA